MRLNKNDTIAGYPAKTIRDLLRQYGRSVNGAGVGFAANLLEVNEEAANQLLRQLASEGYLESYKNHGNETLWRNTIKGYATASAKFLKSIPRQKASEILHRFLDRVAALNKNPYFFIGVERIEVFGSYLTEAAYVNDIDLIVHYRWKGNLSDREQEQLSEDRVREAEKNGRTFSSFLETLYWPEREAELYLRAREPRLSLHKPQEEIVKLVHPRLLYQGPQDIFGKSGE